MIEFLESHNLLGIFIGLCTFLIIGMFHPLVIKGEYFFGVKIWWIFLITGILCGFFAWYVDNLFWSIILGVTGFSAFCLFWSIILGVTGFSAFWGIGEIFQQQERVRKGWFPRNPRRRYPFDNE